MQQVKITVTLHEDKGHNKTQILEVLFDKMQLMTENGFLSLKRMSLWPCSLMINCNHCVLFHLIPSR